VDCVASTNVQYASKQHRALWLLVKLFEAFTATACSPVHMIDSVNAHIHYVRALFSGARSNLTNLPVYRSFT
jgi:hypothetical protein